MVSELKMQKPFCVIDACSIVVLTHLEISDIHLGGSRIRNSIMDYFTFFTPDFIINNEIENAMRKYEVVFENATPVDYLSKINKIEYDAYKCCLDVVNYWIDNKGIILKKEDEGEKRCLALSLYLSRNKNDNVFLLSDDKRARNKILDRFINSQKIGLSLSFPDLLLYMYFRIKFIKKEHILKSLQEYYRVLPARQILNGRRQEYMEWLRDACRDIGTERNYCNLECFNN